jgi:hypothetical protein
MENEQLRQVITDTLARHGSRCLDDGEDLDAVRDALCETIART